MFVPIHFWGCLLSKGNFGRKKKKTISSLTQFLVFPSPPILRQFSRLRNVPPHCRSTSTYHSLLASASKSGLQVPPVSEAGIIDYNLRHIVSKNHGAYVYIICLLYIIYIYIIYIDIHRVDPCPMMQVKRFSFD